MTPDERTAFLDRECAGDQDLRADVQSLLDADASVPAFLADDGLADAAHQRAAAALANPIPSASIGGYAIREIIGRGGMGVVYRAEQTDPQRDIALKVIRPGAMDGDTLRRFRHEARVLGRLDHPGIARIYEAGVDTSTGIERSYLAMELIEGTTLTEYVRDRNLDDRERLRLIADVCDAVQHAHQRGVIHRDLKPGNVLVGNDDRPRLVDFGVARSFGSETLVTTMATNPGQLVGTLPYMSPEQLGSDPDDVDTRSDVYALGLVLYELMTDHRPREFDNCTIYEAVRIVREQTIPKLGTVNRRFRGDVETIVARATDPDRERRYQSAADLASDIRLHLDDRPITARQDAPLYVAMRHARRHVRTLVVLGVVLAAMAGFVVVKQRDRMNIAELNAMTALLAVHEEVKDPFSHDLPPIEQVELVSTRLRDRGHRGWAAERAADAHSLVGHGFLKHGRYVEAEDHFDRGLALLDATGNAPSIEYAAALHDHGRALFFLSDFAAAEAQYRAALAMRESLQERRMDEDAQQALASAIADTTNDIGACLKRQGMIVEAESWYLGSLAQRRALGLDRWVAASLNNVATWYREQGRWEEAEVHFRDGLALIETFDDVNPLFVARGLRNVANCCIELRKLDEAETLIDHARTIALENAGSLHHDAIRCEQLAARLAQARGDYDEAERLALEVRDAYAALGDHPRFEVVSVLSLLGEVRCDQGRRDAALGAFDEALAISNEAFGRQHPTTGALLAARAMNCGEQASTATEEDQR